ncbi:MAG: DUF1844 domain-containing protein [bacterium]|nr:DUF1844 domain-containing protein [bacterium]
MSDEKEETKIVDRRRFDADGNERSTETDKSNIETTSQASKAKSLASEELPPIDFSSFVMSLATQALMQLGEMPAPPGVNISKNVASAKQSIDILSLIEIKTRGNLDTAERTLLGDILHNLRISFVKASKK